MRRQAIIIAVVMAFMLGSAGIAVFPPIAQLAAPIVCGGGHLATTSMDFSSSPGTRTTQTTLACVDANGATTPLPAIFVMVVITVELSIPFVATGWWISAQVWPAYVPEDDEDDGKDEDDDE